jgi:hypothetical protein
MQTFSYVVLRGLPFLELVDLAVEVEKLRCQVAAVLDTRAAQFVKRALGETLSGL